jgi:hypothetical protein
LLLPLLMPWMQLLVTMRTTTALRTTAALRKVLNENQIASCCNITCAQGLELREPCGGGCIAASCIAASCIAASCVGAFLEGAAKQHRHNVQQLRRRHLSLKRADH